LDNKKEDDLLPIDFCPRCGIKLKDSKKSTRINHDINEHTVEILKVKKQARKRKIRTVVLLIAVAAMVTMMASGIGSGAIDSDCRKALSQINEKFRSEEFTQTEIDLLIENREKCSIFISSSKSWVSSLRDVITNEDVNTISP